MDRKPGQGKLGIFSVQSQAVLPTGVEDHILSAVPGSAPHCGVGDLETCWQIMCGESEELLSSLNFIAYLAVKPMKQQLLFLLSLK